MKRKPLLALVLLVLMASVSPAQETWTPEKMMREVHPGNATFSPDGKWLAYTLSKPLFTDGKSEYLTHIWVAAVDGSQSIQLTQGEQSCDSPTWSPDGKWIAFTSARSGRKNIWLIRPTGGEALRLTDAGTGVGSFAWSPDGSEIAFLMRDAATEEEKAAVKNKDDVYYVDETFKYTHLYRVSATPPRDGFAEPVRITEGDFQVVGFKWSPKGDSLVFSHWQTPSINHWRTSDVTLVPRDGGELKPLERAKGSDSGAIFCPKGEAVAYCTGMGDDYWGFRGHVCIQTLSDGEKSLLPETYGSQPRLVSWAPDGSGIYFTEPHRVTLQLFFIPLDGGEAQTVVDLPGDVSDIEISPDGKQLAYCYQDLNKPIEIYVAPLEGHKAGKPTRITNANDHMLDTPLAKAEVITWTSFDGTEIDGILYYPLGYEEGKQYPLLLNVHGGPADHYRRKFSAAADFYPLQAFQAKGFFVLRANPRGSMGYSWQFRYANASDWGGGDYKDLMAGVDYVIEQGKADPERLGILGWSYGGYMSSWTITHTDRFKAAAVGAGVTNLISFTGTTDIVDFLPSYLEGEMWERYDLYRERSPMHHIADANTPTLVIHGLEDFRVPPGQGFELYNALKRKGVPARMLAVPRTGHWPTEPRPVIRIGEEQINWFCMWLLEEE